MNTKNLVRVRFAPSPTGHLHIGGLRTAIFNLLFARHHRGTFLVRIEDTDVERSKPEYVSAIFHALEWMKISSDEPIYNQTDRLSIYKNGIQKLLDEGKAYRCYCTAQELQAKQEAMGLEYRYDKRCRELPEPLEGRSYTVRFKLPEDVQEIIFDDVIRGTITVDSAQLDDFIIARSDGWPVYNFAVVMDDAYSRITHVIRGEEHISNTPKQILLYQALGYHVPMFAHLPLILGSSGKKLSKRDAAVSVMDYRTDGYLADALFNFLVRLGWSHGDQEVFSRDELVEFFELHTVQKKGAMFDVEKLTWLNGVYIRAASNEQLLQHLKDLGVFDVAVDASQYSSSQIDILVSLYKERAKTLHDIAVGIMSVYYAPKEYDAQGVTKWITHDTASLLQVVIEHLESMEQWEVDELSVSFKHIAEKNDVKMGRLAQPVRLALTGGTSSPGIFELLVIIGKQESIERIKKFISYIKQQ